MNKPRGANRRLKSTILSLAVCAGTNCCATEQSVARRPLNYPSKLRVPPIKAPGSFFQQINSVLHADVRGQRLEGRALYVLVAVDGFEEHNAPGNVDVQHVRLPSVLRHLFARNLKAASFLDTAKQPVAEIDLVQDVGINFY